MKDYQIKNASLVECTKFNSLLQSKDNPFPKTRIMDFMVLGPFILETDGAFETEYLYEREKVLDCDYLQSTCGEANVEPFIGKAEKNDFYGKEYLQWEKGFIKWDQLRFDKEENDGGEFFFVTEQRNCVYYASFYVECDRQCDAVICYENSGSLLYLNGEKIACEPYGRTKGFGTFGYQSAVTFKKGINLVLFKLRVGYICDSFDLGMTNCTIYPAAAVSGNIGFTFPERTAAYLGSKENPRQVFPLFAGAFHGDSAGGKLSYEANGFEETINILPAKKGECQLVRVSVPTGDNRETVEIKAQINGEAASFFVETTPYCGFDGTEYLSSDFHFDTTYHQEQRTYAMGAIYITSRMIDALIEKPDFRATLSEVDYLHPYYSIYPQHRQALKKAFEEGRAEADCFYNQPNDLTSSGEGFVRNLIYGQLYHRDVLGRITAIYSPGDVFGHCNQLSQICSKGGSKALRWGKVIWGLDAAVRQMSPDGTVMLNDRGVNIKEAQRLGIHHAWESSNMLSTVPAYPQNIDTSWQKETVTKAHHCVFSEIELNILKDVENQIKTDGVSKVDLSSRDITQHHSGVLLTRTDFKQANRLCENLLITAEKFASVASIYGAEYPETALDKAWRQLLCAQHHDSITGTNNEISFVDLMVEYREAAELAADIVSRSTEFIASMADTADIKAPVFVFNPHPWARKEPCSVKLPEFAADGYALFDEKGKEYPLTTVSIKDGSINAQFIPKVPAFGFAVYSLEKTQRTEQIICSDSCTIENKYYRLTVDPKLGGGITSLFDKTAKREVILNGSTEPANMISVLREVGDRMESQHEIYTTGQKLASSDYKASVRSEKCGEWQKLIIETNLDIIARVRQEITLFKGIQRVDMKTIVDDYQFRDDLFAVTFPVDIKGGKTVFDDRFAPHITGKSKNKLSFQTHQHASYSHSRIAPANQWLELGKTVTVKLSSGKMHNGSFNIGMTQLIRSDSKQLISASEKLLTALSKKAVPVTVFPDTEQHGYTKVIHFNEDLTNTDTRFVLSLDGTDNQYEHKLLSALTAKQREKFCKSLAQNGRAVLYTVDSDNIFNKPIDTVLIKASNEAALGEIIADISSQLSEAAELKLNADICNAQLTEADDYGAAIINNGTIACSVEGESTICMMLFHTADFYGNQGKVTGDKQLIPEQKTHCFTYAFYPHSGDYRSAEVYKKALEFNDALFAKSDVKQDEAKLFGRSKSFAQCSGNFVITAMKVGGYPAAQMKSDFGKAADRGLVIRGFEPNGVASNAVVRLDFDILSLEKVNLLEENGEKAESGKHSFKIDAGAHSIETYFLKLSDKHESRSVLLGAQAEPVQPVYVRSWEHDAGSMPMGYMAVAGVIGKKTEKISDTEYRFTVSMANNHPDSVLDCTMHLLLPDGFKADKTEFPCSVEAGGMFVDTVTVTKPSADVKGVLRLQYEHKGQQFEDIYEFGYFNPTVEVKIDGDKIKAFVTNSTVEKLYGELSIATPFETWLVTGFNACALGSMTLRTVKVELAPNERREYDFDICFEDESLVNAYWAAAKLMVNGRVHFGFDCKKGALHNKWTHTYWYETVGRNNGSIREILEQN